MRPPREPPLRRDRRRRPLEERVEGDRAHQIRKARWPQNGTGGVRKIALSVLGTSFAGPHDPGAGRAQAKVAGTLDAATQTRRGEEEVRVLSSPKFAPVAGPEHSTLRWLHAAAQAADFRARG
jgi:hypothetical protein